MPMLHKKISDFLSKKKGELAVSSPFSYLNAKKRVISSLIH